MNDKDFDKPAKNNISLRDYFAAKAMSANILGWRNTELSRDAERRLYNGLMREYGGASVINALAKESYKIADAMLTERKQTNKNDTK